MVIVGIVGVVILFIFVVATGFLYEAKHPHRDGVSLSDSNGERRESREDSSSEAQEPVSEENAVAYYDSEEMSDQENDAVFDYLTAFRTRAQSKLRKYIVKPMANGTVVSLVIDASGHLVKSGVSQSAGVDNDKLVLKVVRSIFPLKLLPKGVRSPLRAEILIK